ncbi:MAG: DUF2190 family protein [Roseburia sp.]|nr:DUF2190 family protein [Roseburia sp.]MCM1097730.1 DUF2190 family protein [Ruminococcus flavefaciens]
MSKAEYWQRGEVIDFTNSTEAKIEANEIVVFGKRLGVAGTPIEVGETGSLHVFGVFEMPKAESEAITEGATVYYDAEAGAITATAGDITAGYATEAAAAADTTVKVKLLG